MIDVASCVACANNASKLVTEGNTMALSNAKMREHYNKLVADINTLTTEVDAERDELAEMVKAAAILASVSEEHTSQILNSITGVINKALGVLFPNDTKTVSIEKTLYRDTHPHYILNLKTAGGVTRAFNQSGTGLAQTISFLFTTCLIDSRNGRKIMVMDELLNGLHPDAKSIVSDLMVALSTRKHDPFQFVCVEYGMDIGKQYEIKKGVLPNGLSVAEVWDDSHDTGYYMTQALSKVKT